MQSNERSHDNCKAENTWLIIQQVDTQAGALRHIKNKRTPQEEILVPKHEQAH